MESFRAETGLTVTNSSSSANLSPNSLNIGSTVVNATHIVVATLNTTNFSTGGNVVLSTSDIKIGNSTANAFANSILVKVANSSGSANLQPTQLVIGIATVNATALKVGANVFANATSLFIGNNSVNTVANSSVLKTNQITITGAISANGGVGASGEVLHSSGSKAYWTTLPTVDVGDIIMTFDTSMKSGFVELDGSTITDGALDYPTLASRYSWMVSGNNIILPDFRGRFPRSWAHGSTNDPDKASRSARAGDGQSGDYPGTYQTHAINDHTHTYSYNNIVGFYSGGGLGAAGGGVYSTATSSVYVGGVNSGGGTKNETRPINMYVTYQMRVI